MQATEYKATARILAFLSVSCAIGAVAWLIRDYSLLAIGIPGLAAGHYYSWRRPRASLLRSVMLLLFMILTIYLGGDILLSGLSDRLLLTRYLIYGLVLGSFDLMRRGNVMASLVLGVLLMVLISELALDFWFLAFLIPFLIFAVLSAISSRAELDAENAELVGELDRKGHASAWAGFSVAVLLIAGVFFLTIPRIASGQVTQASWLPSRLDFSQRGPSMLPSRPGASISPGILPFTPGGEGSDGRQYVPLGYTGSFADTPVMHVRSRVSSYWRGLTLDEYDGRGWLSSDAGFQLRQNEVGAFFLPDSRINPQTERSYWQIYYLLTDQPNAVFTGYNPGALYLPYMEAGYLEKGTLYRALSATPFLRPDALRVDRVAYENISDFALPGITERTASLAETVVEGAENDYEKAARIEQFLIANYPYKLDIEPLPEGRDAVDYFLFEQQAGYCSGFATAMAVMARHVGLPARVAAGYLPGYIDPLTGAHIVRIGDAHAWVEIFFQRHGWVAFDPTPRPDASMGFATGRNWVYFGIDDFTGTSLTTVLEPLGGTFSVGQLSAPLWLWALGGGVFALLTFVAVRKRWNGHAKAVVVFTYTRLDGEERRSVLKLYDRMVSILEKKGVPHRTPSQSLLEYGDMASDHFPGGRNVIELLTGLAIRAAYDPGLFSLPGLKELKSMVSDLKRNS